MSILSDTVVYDTALAVLEIAMSAYSDKELRSIDTYVSHEPPAEDCCGSLVVYPQKVYPGFGFNENGQDMRVYAYVIDLVVSIRECAPPLGSNGESPTPAQNDDYAKLTMTTMYKVLKKLNCARISDTSDIGNCDFSTPPVADPVEELGQCAGWDITLTVGFY